jgi:hypothetical protein
MTLRLIAVSFEALDPVSLGAFWAGVLGRESVPEANGTLLPGDDTQIGLRFVLAAREKTPEQRLHIHLTSSSDQEQRDTVDKVLRLGGTRFGVKPLPVGRFISLADPGGNEFCVIEAGNSFLAGTGFLGEVTCVGTREVGMFWRDALGWPLVWDQGEETAIQSPRGGTKISWDGPVPPRSEGNQQRFDLAASDVAAEVERLVSLGATRLGDRDGVVGLADPDGNDFSVSPD